MTTDTTQRERFARLLGVRQESHLHAETKLFGRGQKNGKQFAGHGGLSPMEWCMGERPFPVLSLISRPKPFDPEWGGGGGQWA